MMYKLYKYKKKISLNEKFWILLVLLDYYIVLICILIYVFFVF